MDAGRDPMGRVPQSGSPATRFCCWGELARNEDSPGWSEAGDRRLAEPWVRRKKIPFLAAAGRGPQRAPLLRLLGWRPGIPDDARCALAGWHRPKRSATRAATRTNAFFLGAAPSTSLGVRAGLRQSGVGFIPQLTQGSADGAPPWATLSRAANDAALLR